MVEGGFLGREVVVFVFGNCGGVVVEGLVGAVVFFPYATADGAETLDGGAEVWRKERGNFTADAGGEFAAVVGCGDADLEGAV